MKIYKELDNGVKIVEYDNSLAAALAEMWNKSRDSWGGGSGVSTAEQEIAKHSGSTYFNVYVAMLGDEAVGYCSFDRFFKDADTLYVSVLNVRPDFHGKKVGKELVLQCVNRTIEMGYDRLDIHTWAGNTKAVPLYKKCGFLWEDRADTTHLSNFVPLVLKTELFKDFFETAGWDWYKDSDRVIEIKPDGVKVNKFEIYGYSWQKDGKKLAVGFEKTGRKIRFVETDDYKIEFMADNHELAFGLSYKCSFKVLNKSGKLLDIKIKSKNDKGIKFDFNAEANVTETAEFEGGFYVEAIKEAVDPARVLPSVLADVYVNGKHVEFGLGIEPKFPLSVRLTEKRKISQVGLVEDVYISIHSSLNQKSTVKVTLPENGLTRFFENNVTVGIEPNGNAMIKTQAEILKCGYEKLDVSYLITLDGGGEVKFERPIHLFNHGIDGVYSFENENSYNAINGLWRLNMNKKDNHVNFNNACTHGNAGFRIPRLGKPYSDEFNLAKPADVRFYKDGAEAVFEADFESEKFKGVVLTEIYSFNASGVLKRRHRVTNKSQYAQAIHFMEEFWSSVGYRAIFHYDGKIHEIKDNSDYGFSNIHAEKIDENWIFDASSHEKSGIYWPKQYKPQTKWGNALMFEHDCGELPAGEVFETEPTVYMSGVFQRFNDFRNYVRGIHEEVVPFTTEPVEITFNSLNPFVSGENIEASVKNNRLKVLSGEVKFSSPDGAFDSETQVNPQEIITEQNVFNIKLNAVDSGVYLASLGLDFQSLQFKRERAFFVSDKLKKIDSVETDGVYSVTNGELCFKASPDYSDALYSLKFGGNEWLFSKYPEITPYAWWNPFIGGLQAQLPRMNNNLIRREKITAEFVCVSDKFGNEWSGIKTVVSVDKFDAHKGMSYEQYYVTMPGLPVLCYFAKYINKTGEYKNVRHNWNAYISGADNLTDIYAQFKSDKIDYRMRMGGDNGIGFEKLLKLSYENEALRKEKLYVYSDSERCNAYVSGDKNFCQAGGGERVDVAAGEAYTAQPIFLILTEKELTIDSVTDLERIRF